MLVPKRVKHRREHRGKLRGAAKGGKFVAFGDYGLQALDSSWISNRQIEAARIAMTRYMKRGGKVWIKIFLTSLTLKKVLGYVWVMVKGHLQVGLHQLSAKRLCSKLVAFLKKLPVKHCGWPQLSCPFGRRSSHARK